MIIPFGYTMENGRIEINRQQTETLRGIFREYIQGTSLKAKAEELSEDKIEYAPRQVHLEQKPCTADTD